MSRDWKSSWLVLIFGALILGGLVIAAWSKYLETNFVQTAVLAVTAVIILWYTVETMRLRREAEARAKRDREPRVYFEVKQLRNTIFPGSDVEYRVGFNFINHSPNSAVARVRIRLRIGSQEPVLSSNPAYNGQQIWEITPFFKMSGWFDLMEVIERAQRHPGEGSQPPADMVLNVQVDLYRPDLEHFDTSKKEWRIRVGPNMVVEFWPEIATSLTALACPKELP